MKFFLKMSISIIFGRDIIVRNFASNGKYGRFRVKKSRIVHFAILVNIDRSATAMTNIEKFHSDINHLERKT